MSCYKIAGIGFAYEPDTETHKHIFLKLPMRLGGSMRPAPFL